MRSTSLQGLTIVALAVTASIGMAATKAYFVEPRELHQGWTRQGRDMCVGQSFVANVDSIYYVEWFVGDLSAYGVYVFDILDQATGQLIAHGQKAVPRHGWQWVRCDTFTQGTLQFTRGREYVVEVGHSAGDSVSYVYRMDNPYSYGAISVGGGEGHTPPGNANDLCLRLYGRMNAVDSSYWAMVPMVPWPWEPDLRQGWWARAREAGVGAARFVIPWDLVQRGGPGSFDYSGTDSELSFLMDSVGSRVFCLLNSCARFASSREDTTLEGEPYLCIHCAPRGLYDAIGSDSNYWALFVGRTVRHLDSTGRSIHVYEIFNEVNDTCVNQWMHESLGIAGWWRRPNLDYRTGFGGLRGLCSLYVRLCDVATTVIRAIPGHGGDTIFIGSLARVTDESEALGLVSGKEWLRTCYEIGTQDGTVAPFWDGVSVHPYQGLGEFNPPFFEANAETLRAIMRDHHLGPLWCTEIGWDTADGSQAAQERNARNLCKTFVTSKASEALPEGGYDQTCWWLFRESGDSTHPERCGHFPLLDWTTTRPYVSFYAFKQMTRTLTGKRFNGRVVTGNPSEDNSARMYEFEDTVTLKRTWVCWKDGDTKRGVGVKLPVRSNSLAAESLAYTGDPPSFSPSVAHDGWLSLTLNSRPVYVGEKGVPMRPDLRVDSVQYVRASKLVRAWATNRGTDATPARFGASAPYPTHAVLRTDGDSVAQAVRKTAVSAGHQAEFTFDLGQTKLPDTVLISVTVNPGQTFVELGTDDNTGYTLVAKP